MLVGHALVVLVIGLLQVPMSGHDAAALGAVGLMTLLLALGSGWAPLTVLAAGALVWQVSGPALAGGQTENLLVILVLYCAVLWARSRGLWAIAGVAVGDLGLHLVARGWPGFWTAWDDLTLAVPIAVCGHWCLQFLVRRLEELERARAVRVSTSLIGLAETSGRNRRLVLHDEVVGTLTVVGRAGLVPPEEARRQCGELLHRLEGGPPVPPSTSAAGDAAAPLPGATAGAVRHSVEQAHEWTVTALSGAWDLPWRTTVALVLANLALAGRGLPDAVAPAWQVGLMALLAVTNLAIGRVQRRRALRPLEIAMMSTFVALSVAAGITVLGVETLTDYRSWYIGFASLSLCISAFYLPPGLVLATVAAPTLVIGVAGWSSGTPLALWMGALAAPVVPPLVALGLGGFLRHSWGLHEAEWDRTATAVAAADRRRAEAESHDLAWLRSVVVPWLQQVVSTAEPWDAAAVATASQELADATRDVLNVPGALDPVLAHRVLVARRNGTSIEFAATTEPVLGHEEVLRVLDRLLDHAALVDRIMVRLPDRGHGEAEIAWVALHRPGIPVSERNALVSGLPRQVRIEDDAVVCTLGWQTRD